MGFLKKIGKALGKAVKGVTGTVTKVVNTVAPVAELIPGAGGVVKVLNTANNLVQGSGAVKGAQTVTTVLAGGKTVTTTPKQAVVAAQNGVGVPVTAKTASNIKTSGLKLTGNPVIDAAIGGAAVGAGTAIGGTQVGNNVVNSTGWQAFKTWASNNWYWVVGGLAVLIGGIWYFVKGGKRKSKGKLFGR